MWKFKARADISGHLKDSTRKAVKDLHSAVVGSRIVSVSDVAKDGSVEIVTDQGVTARISTLTGCCSSIRITDVLKNFEGVENVITGVKVDSGVTSWSILADMNEVLRLDTDWHVETDYYAFGLVVEVVTVNRRKSGKQNRRPR